MTVTERLLHAAMTFIRFESNYPPEYRAQQVADLQRQYATLSQELPAPAGLLGHME